MTTSGYSTIKVTQKNKIIHIYPDKKELGKVFTPILGIKANSNIFSSSIKNKIINNTSWIKWAEDCRKNYIIYSSPPKYLSEPDMGNIMVTLREKMPSNTIITIDAGNFSGWPQRFWKYTLPKTQLAPTSGAMGYSIPAALSAKIAKKNSPVIAFCGDGGFMMSSQELATCHQYTDLVNPDFKLLCKGYHAHYENVKHSKNFSRALDRCLNSNKASVIEIEIDPKQITTRQRMEELNN